MAKWLRGLDVGHKPLRGRQFICYSFHAQMQKLHPFTFDTCAMDAFELVGAAEEEIIYILNDAASNTEAYRNTIEQIQRAYHVSRLRPVARPQLISKDDKLCQDEALWAWAAADALVEQRSRKTLLTALCCRCAKATGFFCTGCEQALCTSCDEQTNFECPCCGNDM